MPGKITPTHERRTGPSDVAGIVIVTAVMCLALGLAMLTVALLGG